MASSVFLFIIAIYLLALLLRAGFRVTSWITAPLWQWFDRRACLGRYPYPYLHGPQLWSAKGIYLCVALYRWFDLRVRDLLAHYLLLFGFFYLLIYLTLDWPTLGPVNLVILAVLIPCIVPTFFLVCITEPLGLCRTSYLLANLARFTYRRDHHNGPLFSEILAWQRRNRVGKRAVRRKKLLWEILESRDQRLSATILCRMLLEVEPLTPEQRIGMLMGFCFVEPMSCPRRVQAKAGLWLTVLECEQENWSAARKWSGRYLRKSFSPNLLFFHLLARHRDGQGLQTRRGSLKKETAPLDHSRPDRTAGLRVLYQLESMPRLRKNRAAVHELARYFEAVLEQEQGRKPEETKQQALVQVETVLSDLFSEWSGAAEGLIPDEEKSVLVQESRETTDDQLLEPIFSNLNGLEHRFLGDHYLGTNLEWLEWAGILYLYEQCCVSDHLRYAAWCAARDIFWNWGAWLWNEYRDCVLANALFQWVRTEAIYFEDYDTAAAMDENL